MIPVPARRFAAVLTSVLFVALTAAQTSRPAAEISGGLDDSGQWFHWKVSNNTQSPIVALEIPHHQGDLLQAPPGWASRWVDSKDAEARDGKDWVFATAPEPRAGIAAGATVPVSLRIRHGGVQTGRDAILVRFADGRTFTVGNIEMPRAPSAGERYSTTIGFAIIVVIIALAARRRRRRAGEPAAEDDALDADAPGRAGVDDPKSPA